MSDYNKIRPVGNKVAITRLPPESMSKGGIIIPDRYQDKSQIAKVIAVGPGKTLEDGTIQPICVEVGQTVVIPYWAGNDTSVGDHSFICIHDTDILAIIEDD